MTLHCCLGLASGQNQLFDARFKVPDHTGFAASPDGLRVGMGTGTRALVLLMYNPIMQDYKIGIRKPFVLLGYRAACFMG